MDDQETPPAVRPWWRKRTGWIWLGGVIGALTIYNLSVTIPAGRDLADDGRESGYSMVVYRTWLVHPQNIVVDLRDVSSASRIDLYRGLRLAAEGLDGRSFGEVSLARNGKTVFVMSGEDFAAYGRYGTSLAAVQRIPEQVRLPDGQPAFGSWSGGWLGVMTRRLEDVNTLAEEWAAGEASAYRSRY